MTMTDDVTAEVRRRGAVDTIRAGIAQAPALGRGLAITFLLALLGAAGRASLPIVIQLAIDNGLDTGSGGGSVRVDYIVRLCAIAAAIIIAAAVCQRMAVYRLGTAAEEGLYGLRVRLFDHIHRLSLADHNEERRGALVARVTSDIETLTMFFAWGGLAWMLDLSLMFVVACVMLAYDWVLAVVAFAVVAPLIIVLRFVQAKLVRAYDKVREDNAQMLSLMSETVSGAETLQAYDAVEPAIERLEQATQRRAKSSVRAGVIGAFLFPSGEVFSVFTVVAVVGIGIWRGTEAGLSAGALVGYMFLTYRFLEPIAEFTEVIDQSQTAVAGMRRVLGILDTPIGPPPAENPVALPAGRLGVALHDVSFAYAPRDDEPPANVLTHLQLTIPPGQHVALVGESGAGKRGRATRGAPRRSDVGARDHRCGEPAACRQRRLAPTTHRGAARAVLVRRDHFVQPALRQTRCDRCRPRRCGAHARARRLGGGPRPRSRHAGRPARPSSFCRRAPDGRVAARLAREPRRAHPRRGDVVGRCAHRGATRASLRKLSEGRTTISIAHRLSTAARADRVVVMAYGRVVEDGSHEALMALDGEYKRMYDAWLAATRA